MYSDYVVHTHSDIAESVNFSMIILQLTQVTQYNDILASRYNDKNILFVKYVQSMNQHHPEVDVSGDLDFLVREFTDNLVACAWIYTRI